MKKRSTIRKKKKTLRLDEALIEQIEELATQQRRSFNFMMTLAAEKLVEDSQPKKKRSYTRKEKIA